MPADTYNTIMWLPERDKYLYITRTDFGTDGGWREIRGIRFMTNPDVKADP